MVPTGKAVTPEAEIELMVTAEQLSVAVGAVHMAVWLQSAFAGPVETV